MWDHSILLPEKLRMTLPRRRKKKTKNLIKVRRENRALFSMGKSNSEVEKEYPVTALGSLESL